MLEPEPRVNSITVESGVLCEILAKEKNLYVIDIMLSFKNTLGRMGRTSYEDTLTVGGGNASNGINANLRSDNGAALPVVSCMAFINILKI